MQCHFWVIFFQYFFSAEEMEGWREISYLGGNDGIISSSQEEWERLWKGVSRRFSHRRCFGCVNLYMSIYFSSSLKKKNENE